MSVDPLTARFPAWSPYAAMDDNPILKNDPTGMAASGPDDWVLGKNGAIKWDKDAKSQATTKAGEAYLGKTLTFTFNSYINGKTWDGPLGDFPAGNKLTSTINITSNTDADNNLLSVNIKSSYVVGSTGGIFKGRNYFSGQKNIGLDIKGANAGSATFEQHASVNGFEAAGLNTMGYDVVNVAQKLTFNLGGNKLSVTAATDVFPSATLSVNGNLLFQYNQPSFSGTHGIIKTLTGFRSPTNKLDDGPTPIYIYGHLRPAPNFYDRFKD